MNKPTRKQFIQECISSPPLDCVLWPFAIRKSNGYGAHSERIDGKRVSFDAHRRVCELAHGAPKDGMEAAHSCGNKQCVNPDHLSWKTHQENMDDAKNHGTLKGGGRYRRRFFNREIAAIVSSKESLLVLAAQFATDVAYIGRLKRKYANG